MCIQDVTDLAADFLELRSRSPIIFFVGGGEGGWGGVEDFVSYCPFQVLHFVRTSIHMVAWS